MNGRLRNMASVYLFKGDEEYELNDARACGTDLD